MTKRKNPNLKRNRCPRCFLGTNGARCPKCKKPTVPMNDLHNAAIQERLAE